jgi:hypothetical protein
LHFESLSFALNSMLLVTSTFWANLKRNAR